jgi:hypothetical protein
VTAFTQLSVTILLCVDVAALLQINRYCASAIVAVFAAVEIEDFALTPEIY